MAKPIKDHVDGPCGQGFGVLAMGSAPVGQNVHMQNQVVDQKNLEVNANVPPKNAKKKRCTPKMNCK